MDILLESVISNDALLMVVKTAIRLFLAVLFSGFIGNEREHINRPAGIRTHVLVCVGAALVMMTSEFVAFRYNGVLNMDPTRLGAQVVSGIGFLGAGTIIKEGFNVKGLTTAASLWTVSCIGIAVGAGFYFGAAFATFVTFFILRFIKKLVWKHNDHKLIMIRICGNTPIHDIFHEFNRLAIPVNYSEITVGSDNAFLELHMSINAPKNKELLSYAADRVRMIEGVDGVHVE